MTQKHDDVMMRIGAALSRIEAAAARPAQALSRSPDTTDTELRTAATHALEALDAIIAGRLK